MPVGREHGEQFKCGLCEYITEDLESLYLHLLTCKVYKCNNWDLKEYFLTEHENDKQKNTTHMKKSREDKHSYDTRRYSFKELNYTKHTTQTFTPTKGRLHQLN